MPKVQVSNNHSISCTTSQMQKCLNSRHVCVIFIMKLRA